MKSLPCADSTRVFPHQPSPTMAAFIMITSGYFGYKWPVARSVFGEAKDSQLQIWRGQPRRIRPQYTLRLYHVSPMKTLGYLTIIYAALTLSLSTSLLAQAPAAPTKAWSGNFGGGLAFTDGNSD